eukprot:gene28613-30620_t
MPPVWRRATRAELLCAGGAYLAIHCYQLVGTRGNGADCARMGYYGTATAFPLSLREIWDQISKGIKVELPRIGREIAPYLMASMLGADRKELWQRRVRQDQVLTMMWDAAVKGHPLFRKFVHTPTWERAVRRARDYLPVDGPLPEVEVTMQDQGDTVPLREFRAGETAEPAATADACTDTFRAFA